MSLTVGLFYRSRVNTCFPEFFIKIQMQNNIHTTRKIIKSRVNVRFNKNGFHDYPGE